MQLPELCYSRYVPSGAVCVRDKASDAVVYLYERNGAFLAVAYHGKAAKPDWHFRYPSVNKREAKVRQHFEWRRLHTERKVVQRAELAKVRERGVGLDVGAILVSSWGYEQTNVDWYQVVRIVGKATVEIRQIGSLGMGETGWASGQCAPDIDRFIGPPMIKRVGRDRKSVKMASYAYATLWDGRPRHWSSYA